MKILIDNGHEENTPGKRFPDGRFREYKYNREIAKAVVEHLQMRGYDAELLVSEEEDIPLKERVRRANKLSCQIGHPIQETIIISIHVKASFPGHTESDGIVFYLSDAGRKAIIGLYVELWRISMTRSRSRSGNRFFPKHIQ